MTEVAAVITLDPAATANCGLCVRGGTYIGKKDKVVSPNWYTTSSVWNPVMHDELTRELAKLVPRGGRVTMAATATAFHGVALDIGRAIGCIEGIMHDMNLFDTGDKAVQIQDNSWRAKMYSWDDRKRIGAVKSQQQRRKLWKELAVATVYAKYKIETDDNAAEAILLNDYVVLFRDDLMGREPIK